jgi:deoxyribose-phosphate aldolase
MLGPNWIMPSTFRFGASGLLDDILALLNGGTSARSAGGY